MSAEGNRLAVTLTVDELRALLREEVLRAMAPPPRDQRAILTRAQVAELLQVHPNVVPRYIRDRALPAHRVGAEYRFIRTEVMAWIRNEEPCRA